MGKNKRKDVPKILMTFVGNRDPFANAEQDGPILSLLSEHLENWQKIVLVYTPRMDSAAQQTEAVIQKRYPAIKIVTQQLAIEDPTHYESIIKALRQGFDQVRQERMANVLQHGADQTMEEGVQYYISASSGTPAMHACWLLLTASGEIPAKLIQVRDPKYIKKGQPRVTKIDPQARSFPTVRSRIDLKDLPAIEPKDIDDALEATGIVGAHPQFVEALDKAARVASTKVPVLILGETGTGKEALAEFIHEVSDRRKKPFIDINCGGIPENLVESILFGYKKGAFTGADQDKKGCFDAADDGTLFLDEIGEMSLSAQVAILRALQEKEIKPVGDNHSHKINVRIIAATNRDIHKAISQKAFREDLYYRLNLIEIYLPSLNERQNDIQPLAEKFLEAAEKEHNRKKRLSSEALAALRRYHWPGNIRELQNVIESAVLLSHGESIRESDLKLKAPWSENESDDFIPVAFHRGFCLPEFMDGVRSRIIERALDISGNRRKDAAALLGASPQSISNYISRKAKR